MRKLMIFVLLLLFVVPNFAQESEATLITEIVTSAAAGDGQDAEFTILLAALQAADPLFLQVLADPDASVTVFAPTDAAFEELAEALGASPQGLLGDRLFVNDLLSYHIVPVVLPQQSLFAMNGGVLGTLLNRQSLRVSTQDSSIFINASEIITPDLFATNGMVHVIDTVLATSPSFEFQPSGSLADIVVANAADASPEFSILLAAAEAADPIVLAKLTGNLPYTIFAPTDAAFNAALQELGVTAQQLLADTDRLTEILSYHIVPGRMTFDDLFASYLNATGTPRLATLLPGTTLDIIIENNTIVMNYANIILPDVLATNGVIHVIDAVLIPPA